MKFRFFMLFALVGSLLSAQSRYTLLETLFIPATFYVGDTVEMHITFFPGEAQDLFVSTDLAVLDWVEIKNVQMIPQLPNYKVIITFTPFATGSRTLPQINLGSLNLEDLRIYTSSLLENNELAPPREQVLLPMTEFTLTLILGLLVFIPLILWKTHTRMRNWYLSLRQTYNRLRPFKKFTKETGKLKVQLFGLESSEYYRRLQIILREYLSARWGKDLLSFTTQELRDVFGVHLDRDSDRIFTDFFQWSDVVIYDRRQVADQRALEDLEILLKTAQKMEETSNVEL